MDKAECKDQYSEPETEEHLNGKRDLYEWICQQENVKNAVLEGWIPETKQRPDIMFEYNNRKYVIEYQCSPIASEYLERHELYKTAGIHDIWICGTEKYLGSNKRLNTLEKNTDIYYNSTHKLFYVLEPLFEKEFKEINKMISLRDDSSTYYKQRKYFNRTFHVMKNNFDFQNAYKNYIHIKDNLNSYYCCGAHYPSPTHRPSRKYPYPVRDYAYCGNHSYATCYKLFNTKLRLKDGGK